MDSNTGIDKERKVECELMGLTVLIGWMGLWLYLLINFIELEFNKG